MAGVWSKKPLCRNYSQASINMPLEAKGCKSSILEKCIFDKQKFWNLLLLRPFQTTTAGLAWSARDRRWSCWSWRWWCWLWWWSSWSLSVVIGICGNWAQENPGQTKERLKRIGLLEVLEVVCNAWILGDIPAPRATTSLKSHLQLFQLLVNVVALLLLHVRLRHVRLHRNLGKSFHWWEDSMIWLDKDQLNII